MTTQPPAADWYPDPTGKPGMMYWDGQQWLTDPAADASPAADQPPLQPTSTTPRLQRHTALIAALVVTFVVLAGIVGITGYLLQQHKHASQIPTAQPALPSAPAAQSAPSSAPPPPMPLYFKTQIGRICEVTVQQVTCQSCIPGERITNAYTCTDPAPGIAVNTAGTIDDNPAAISSYSDVRQLTVGGTEHANGWRIVSDGAWTRFINDATGHGMAVAAQNRYSF
jgi:hypothetical protein